MKNLTLVTGGSRSGKSRFAEHLAESKSAANYYIATMQRIPGDSELDVRIERHQARRGRSWQTFESATVVETIESLPEGPGSVVIDCLSLFVSYILAGDMRSCDDTSFNPYSKETEVSERVEQLLQAIEKRSDLQFVIVTNEVGWGLIPDNRLGRAFRDFLGFANQRVAQCASEVYLSCSGLQLQLKPQAPVLSTTP